MTTEQLLIFGPARAAGAGMSKHAYTPGVCDKKVAKITIDPNFLIFLHFL